MRLLITLFSAVMIFSACEKEDMTDPDIDLRDDEDPLMVEMDDENIDFMGFEDDFESIWDYGMNKYGSQTLCVDCNCTSVNSIQSVLNDNESTLNSYIATTKSTRWSLPLDIACDTLKDLWKHKCDVSSPSELIDSAKSQLEEVPKISSTEEDLLKELLDSIQDGVFNEDYFRSEWNSMVSNGSEPYCFSGSLIEVAAASEQILLDDNIIDDIPNNGDSDALIHKVGSAIAGAGVGVVGKAIYDAATEDNPEITWDEVEEAAILGAAGGVLGS